MCWGTKFGRGYADRLIKVPNGSRTVRGPELGEWGGRTKPPEAYVFPESFKLLRKTLKRFT